MAPPDAEDDMIAPDTWKQQNWPNLLERARLYARAIMEKVAKDF